MTRCIDSTTQRVHILMPILTASTLPHNLSHHPCQYVTVVMLLRQCGQVHKYLLFLPFWINDRDIIMSFWHSSMALVAHIPYPEPPQAGLTSIGQPISITASHPL